MELRKLVDQRHYSSIAQFCSDLVLVFGTVLGTELATVDELVHHVSGRAEDMAADQRERRSLARRVIKAIQPGLEDALRKEAELNGRPYAQQIKDLDAALLSRRDSFAESVEGAPEQVNGIPIITADGDENDASDSHPITSDVKAVNGLSPLEASGKTAAIADTPPASINGLKPESSNLDPSSSSNTQPFEPPTPPISLQGLRQSSLGDGGIPWYVEPFDPDGTTVFEERWTGPEVLREMSEELSEMGEDELEGLALNDPMDVDRPAEGSETANVAAATAATRNKPVKSVKRGNRRSRGPDWGARSFRNRRWN